MLLNPRAPPEIRGDDWCCDDELHELASACRFRDRGSSDPPGFLLHSAFW